VIAADVADLDDVLGPCRKGGTESPFYVVSEKDYRRNDCISSVRVQPGWGATLFGDRNFEGGKLEIIQDVPNLKSVSGSCSGSYDDCISSIRVYRK